MPWKEQSVMDERMKFVAKLLDGESMSNVCREFGFALSDRAVPIARLRFLPRGTTKP